MAPPRLYLIDGQLYSLSEAKKMMPVYGEHWLRTQLNAGVTSKKELAHRHTLKLNHADNQKLSAPARRVKEWYFLNRRKKT